MRQQVLKGNVVIFVPIPLHHHPTQQQSSHVGQKRYGEDKLTGQLVIKFVLQDSCL